MSTTAGSLIASSLRLLGVLASGESASAGEATDGLVSLNQMLDSWSNETLMIPSRIREVFPLVSGQQAYTMGAGGNFNTARPIKVEDALVQITSVSPVLELGLAIFTKDDYAGIPIKALTSTYPQGVYADHSNPLVNLTLWPVPSQSNNIVLYSLKPLANLASLTSTIVLPPGYERALRYNLALELAPEYGRAIPEVVAQVAMESKQSLKRTNTRVPTLEVEGALRGHGGVWNWYTGE